MWPLRINFKNFNMKMSFLKNKINYFKQISKKSKNLILVKALLIKCNPIKL